MTGNLNVVNIESFVVENGIVTKNRYGAYNVPATPEICITAIINELQRVFKERLMMGGDYPYRYTSSQLDAIRSALESTPIQALHSIVTRRSFREACIILADRVLRISHDDDDTFEDVHLTPEEHAAQRSKLLAEYLANKEL